MFVMKQMIINISPDFVAHVPGKLVVWSGSKGTTDYRKFMTRSLGSVISSMA